LYEVLEAGLKAGKGEYLVGDKYSIVDISSESTPYSTS
jgi:glutathione S-transferase